MCGPLCETTDVTCTVNNRQPRAFGDTTKGGRGGLPKPNGSTDAVGTAKDSFCPEFCCKDENCKRKRDIQGNLVPTEQEFLIIFGGAALRNLTVSGKYLFNNCTDASRAKLRESGYAEDFINQCGAELVNELWLYDVTNHTLTYLKPTYNHLLYSEFKTPSPRQGHAAAAISIASEDIMTKQLVRTR